MFISEKLARSESACLLCQRVKCADDKHKEESHCMVSPKGTNNLDFEQLTLKTRRLVMYNKDEMSS